jgi:hypothetical protein
MPSAEVRSPMLKLLLLHDRVTYKDFLKFLKLHTVDDTRFYFIALSFISIYSGLKMLPVSFGIRDLPGNLEKTSVYCYP